uniref:Uncharacterized protein n=1 Tax=Picocystis salinarum TaxID=88271 RepID=A0A7S3XEW0_9CHLO
MADADASAAKLLEALEQLDLGAPMTLPCTDALPTRRNHEARRYARSELLAWKDRDACAVAPSGLDADLLARNWTWDDAHAQGAGAEENDEEGRISLRPGGALGGERYFARWKSNTPNDGAKKKGDARRDVPVGTGWQASDTHASSTWTCVAEAGDPRKKYTTRASSDERKSRDATSDEGVRSYSHTKSPTKRRTDSKGGVEHDRGVRWNETKASRVHGDTIQSTRKDAVPSKTRPGRTERNKESETDGWDDVQAEDDLRAISSEIERERLLHRKKHAEKKDEESKRTGKTGRPSEEMPGDALADTALSPPSRPSQQGQVPKEPNLFSAYEQFFTTSSPMMRFSDDAGKREESAVSDWSRPESKQEKVTGPYAINSEASSQTRSDKIPQIVPDVQPQKFASFDAFVGATDCAERPLPGLPNQVKTLEEVERSMAVPGVPPMMNQAPPPPGVAASSNPSADLKNLLKIPGAASSPRHAPPGMYPPGWYRPPPPYPVPVPPQGSYMPMPQRPACPAGQPVQRHRILTAEELERGMGQ